MARLLGGSVTLVSAVALLFAVVQFGSLSDWWFLLNYNPSEEIVSLARGAAMGEKGRRLFYLSDPQIDGKAAFSAHCPLPESDLILGCYTGEIFILRVEHPKLAGVMDVTAAHEMLHAAYDVLSAEQRRQVNSQLSSFVKTVDDAEIQEQVSSYRREGRDVLNELHSILPTQLEQLSPELERYYQRYFTDRAKVVEAFADYDGVFEAIEAEHASLVLEISSLRSQIDDLKAQAVRAAEAANSLSDGINRLRAVGRIAESNALVPQQNEAADRARTLSERAARLVEEHNDLVGRANQLALRQEQLFRSLDSSQLTPGSGGKI